jgi:hypothetical protein
MVPGMMMQRMPSAIFIALQNVISGFHIFHPAVGAGTDNDLVDFDIMKLACGMGIFGQVRTGNGRNDF